MDVNSVTVPSRVAAALRRHAAAALPAECCGALIGAASHQRLEVRALIPIPNASPSPDRYHIDAATVLRLERQAECVGLHVVGFYHSHPRGRAIPSTLDLELAWPGYLYFIVSPTAGELRAWRLRDDRGGFAEVCLDSRAAGAA